MSAFDAAGLLMEAAALLDGSTAVDLRAAGGVVTDLAGRPWQIDSPSPQHYGSGMPA